MFSNISAKNDLYLVGDFNINILMDNLKNKYFIDIIYSMGCRPMITRPTRYSDTLNSLIGNIFCNVNCNPIRNNILISDVSDHIPICIIYDVNYATNKLINKGKYKYIRKINDNTISSFRINITKHNWNYIYDNIDLNIIYDTFFEDLIVLYNENIPLINIKDIDNNKKPWIYNSIIKCIKLKNKLYTKV